MTRIPTLLCVAMLCTTLPSPIGGQVRRTNPVVTRTRPIDVKFTVADTVRVRTMVAPAVFDDKGRRQKLSRDELLKFKGDTPEERKMDGYKWDIDNLKRGDAVEVFLSGPAGGAKPKSATDEKAKDEAKNQRWVPRRQLAGVIKTISAGDAKSLTIQVLVTTQQLRGLPDTTEGKVTIGPEQEQATMIVVLKESELPQPAQRPNNPKKNQ
jgi:hypothetical protein